MTDFFEAWDQQRAPRTPPAAAAPVIPRADGQAQAYALAALEGEAERVAAVPIGSGRNHALNTAAFRMGQLVAAGAIDANLVTQILGAVDGGLHYKATRDTIASGLAGGMQQARAIPEPTHPTREVAPWEDPTDPFSGSPAARSADGSAHPPAPSHTAPSVGTGDADSSAASAETADAAPPDPEQVLLALEVSKQRRQHTARLVIAHEDAVRSFRTPEYTDDLAAELALPDDPDQYRVAELLPVGGNALLTAQFKAGKTTLVTNLARSLVDGDPFLGRYEIEPFDGRVGIFNYEVSRKQYRKWLREVGFATPAKAATLPLRGYRLDLRVPYVEQWVVDWLRAHDIRVWIVDPFARAATGIDENSNTEVGQFLDTLDVIKERAGVSELILPVHTGRAEHEQGDERARGATRLDDWADVRWLLTKDKDDTRYFRATGRDVETDESALQFDKETRRLELTGGDRKTTARNRLLDAIITVVENRPGIGVADLRTGVRQILGSAGQAATDAAVETLIYERKIHTEQNGRARGHYLGAGPATARDPFN